jgi:hypothetical protein
VIFLPLYSAPRERADGTDDEEWGQSFAAGECALVKCTFLRERRATRVATQGSNVALGAKADIPNCTAHVRFWG